MTAQETLSSTHAQEEVTIGNLAARMSAVAMTHQLAVLAGLAPADSRDADSAAGAESAAIAESAANSQSKAEAGGMMLAGLPHVVPVAGLSS